MLPVSIHVMKMMHIDIINYQLKDMPIFQNTNDMDIQRCLLDVRWNKCTNIMVGRLFFGEDYISDSSVAFHKYYHPDSLRRLEYLLYGTGEEECNRLRFMTR